LKALAAAVTIGISLKGSFVSDAMIALRRTGDGMKTAEPSKPTRPFSSGAGMLATSLAVLHPASSATVGTMIQQSASAVFKSMSR
jgi:hypothetical protein